MNLIETAKFLGFLVPSWWENKVTLSGSFFMIVAYWFSTFKSGNGDRPQIGHNSTYNSGDNANIDDKDKGYGMMEAGPVLAMCAEEPFDIKSEACGIVVKNAEMTIVDSETCASLSRNQLGKICIRGDQIMKGYLNDPEATKTTIDKDGWLHTSDIGYIDDDDELYIIDRLKELMKYKGFQVAPAELEAMLLAHPDITDAVVVVMKDDLAGEVPVAFVVRSIILKSLRMKIKSLWIK